MVRIGLKARQSLQCVIEINLRISRLTTQSLHVKVVQIISRKGDHL